MKSAFLFEPDVLSKLIQAHIDRPLRTSRLLQSLIGLELAIRAASRLQE